MEMKSESNEQVKEVETLEQVEEVTTEELEAVDKELQSRKDKTKDSVVSSALAAQGSVGFKTIEQIEADLSKPLHPSHLKKLKFGSAKGATYVPWMIAEKYLSHFAPGWSTVSTGFSTPIGVAIIVELTIPTANGLVTRAGHGFEAHQTTNKDGITKDTGFGGAPVVASRQAFKRSAVAFGLGRDLYPV
jgi:hypothetical protein